MPNTMYTRFTFPQACMALRQDSFRCRDAAEQSGQGAGGSSRRGSLCMVGRQPAASVSAAAADPHATAAGCPATGGTAANASAAAAAAALAHCRKCSRAGAQAAAATTALRLSSGKRVLGFRDPRALQHLHQPCTCLVEPRSARCTMLASCCTHSEPLPPAPTSGSVVCGAGGAHRFCKQACP